MTSMVCLAGLTMSCGEEGDGSSPTPTPTVDVGALDGGGRTGFEPGPRDAATPEDAARPPRLLTVDEADPVGVDDQRIYALGGFQVDNRGPWLLYTDDWTNGATSTWVDATGNLGDVVQSSPAEKFVPVPYAKDKGWALSRRVLAFSDNIGPDTTWRASLDVSTVTSWPAPPGRRQLIAGDRAAPSVELHKGLATHPNNPAFAAVTVVLPTLPEGAAAGSLAPIENYQYIARTFDYGATWEPTLLETWVGGLYGGRVVGTEEILTCANSNYLGITGNLSINPTLLNSRNLGGSVFQVSGTGASDRSVIPALAGLPGAVGTGSAAAHAEGAADTCAVIVNRPVAGGCEIETDTKWDNPVKCLAGESVVRAFPKRGRGDAWILQTNNGFFESTDGAVTGTQLPWNAAWGPRALSPITALRYGLLVAGYAGGNQNFLIWSRDYGVTFTRFNAEVFRSLCGPDKRFKGGCTQTIIRGLAVARDAAPPPEALAARGDGGLRLP